MKRLVAPLSVAACLLVPMTASAGHSDGGGPKNDKVDGTVEDIYPSTLHVNAVSNADGTDARGQLWYRADNPAFTSNVAGEVTCLRVIGNRATVGMRIDRAKLPGFPGEGNGFLFVINDNGEPGDLDTHLDLPQITPPMICPSPFAFVFPHKSGNFVVHDAT